MFAYFKKDDNDIYFYEAHIKNRLPSRIIDAHVHMNLPEHVSNVSEETIKSDWALECGLVMPYEDACTYYNALFPDKEVDMVAFPWPLPEANIIGNNSYLSSLRNEGKINSLMTVRPEWDSSFCEEVLLAGGFSGFKPYPYMANAVKGAEVSIFDFMPHEQLSVLEKYHKTVLIHLPRKGRLPDDNNIRELNQLIERYPNIKIVLAHYGRCFTRELLEKGLKKLGDIKNKIYFDTSAVMNPQVHRTAFEEIGTDNILFGTDIPILLWHGRRRWTENDYINLCREDFSWNKHEEPHEEAQYTFFIYEQIKNILDNLDKFGGTKKNINSIFYENAQRVYGLANL